MAENMSESGSTTTCTEKVSIHGQMEGHTRENTKTTKDMGKVSSNGLVGDNTMDNGRKERCMVRASSRIATLCKLMASGLRVRERYFSMNEEISFRFKVSTF